MPKLTPSSLIPSNAKVALGLLGILSFALPTFAAEIPQNIMDAAQQRVDFGLNPGIAMVYIEGSQPPVIKTFGNNSFESDAFAINAQSRFEIGSLSKIFTGLATAMAVESQQVKLDSPLKSLWPNAWQPPHKSLQAINLKQILTHTSGLPRLPQNLQPGNAEDPYANYALNDLQSFLNQYAIQKTPAPYAYSNLAYGLLGTLLPSRLGYSSYAQMLEEQILKPLNMNLSSLEDLENAALSTQPYFEGKPVSSWHMTEAFVGAGALRSNAEDMAQFLYAQLNPPENALGKAIQRSHQVLDTGVSPDPQSMAYAWHIKTIAGREIYWHNGQTGGYLSFMGFDPQTKRGAIVLTNHTDAITDLGLALINPDYQLKPTQDQRLSEQELAKYLGSYELAPNMIFEVKQANGYLMVQLTGQPEIRVFPDGKDRFKYRIVDAQLAFKQNNQGKVIGLTLHQGGEHYAPKI